MRALIAVLVLMAPLGGQRALPSRSEITAMEQGFDRKLMRYSPDTPIEVLGLTRGVYVEGFGAVYSAEVNLVQTPGISPFRPVLTRDDVVRVKMAKQKRIPELRSLMKEMMVSSATSMDRLPPEEQLVLGVALFYNAWEDATGLPRHITMQARRSALVDVAANRQPRSALDQIIRTREE